MNLNRRNFLKTGGAAAAGTLLLPPFLKSCNNFQLNPDVKSYLEHFEVSTETLQKVISAAMSRGGTYADLFFEHKISNSLALEDGKVNRASSNIDYGVGIRVLNGDQTGFAYSETVSNEAMIKAAKMAAEIANNQNKFGAGKIDEKIPEEYYRISQEMGRCFGKGQNTLCSKN